MKSDFSGLGEHLAQACRLRKMRTFDPYCTAAIGLHFAGLRALDIYRLAHMADQLDVSVDWLLGRSDTMELPERRPSHRARRRRIRNRRGPMSSRHPSAPLDKMLNASVDRMLTSYLRH
jgi:hypothetical protein